jgi:hypothetical protein
MLFKQRKDRNLRDLLAFSSQKIALSTGGNSRTTVVFFNIFGTK